MPATDLAERRLLAVLDELVDDRVGIIDRIEEVAPEAGAPAFFHVAAQACDTRALSRNANFGATGGASSSRTAAVAKAAGEAVERYCSALFEVEELPLTSAEEASFPCVDPSDFALHSPEQYREPGFPWVPFEANTPVRWTPASDLLTGETVHVPAAMVFVPYHYYRGTGDAPIVQPISTGLACHSGPARAAVGAICEVVERDAFTLTWQARLPRPQLRVETLSDPNYNLVQRFERTGARVTLLDLTLDLGIPTVLAVLRSDAPTAPALVVAAASDPDPERAVRKSLEELAHTRRYSSQVFRKLPRVGRTPPYENVTDQMGHLNFWADHANVSGADFLFASPDRVDFEDLQRLDSGDPREELELLLGRIRDAGHRALLVDLTTPDVAELGLTVCRAVVPGLHPLFMGHRLRARGGRRLREVPVRLGLEGFDLREAENPLPHPYP